MGGRGEARGRQNDRGNESAQEITRDDAKEIRLAEKTGRMNKRRIRQSEQQHWSVFEDRSTCSGRCVCLQAEASGMTLEYVRQKNIPLRCK